MEKTRRNDFMPEWWHNRRATPTATFGQPGTGRLKYHVDTREGELGRGAMGYESLWSQGQLMPVWARDARALPGVLG